MPYLNWKSAETRPGEVYGQEVTSVERNPSRLEHQLRLTLGPEQRVELALRLEELYAGPEGELRIDLPESWILFWKARAEESRLLIAHPQPGEWVMTAALEPGHGGRFAAALRELRKGESLAVSRGGIIGRVSNGEIVIAAG